ncbi:MAG: TatD family hydrolase [Rikenellaceae bacterium]
MHDSAPYINIHTHNKVEGELSILTVGIHPYAAEGEERLEESAIGESVEAIGEIGLDFSIPIDRDVQETVFREQLALAQKLGFPVVIHAVRSVDYTLEVLREYKLRAVIIHGFIGSKQLTQKATRLGYYLSFGHRCFTSPKTLEALRETPLGNIFFETDTLDISIEEIYNRAAAYRVESLEEIKEQIYKNYKLIFNK